MATFKVLLHSSNRRKDGTYPVSLRIIKNMKAKYISLGFTPRRRNGTLLVNVSDVISVSVLIIRNSMRE